MTRAELVDEAAGWLGNVLTLAKLQATDTPGNLQEPINATLRALGIAQADLETAEVPDGAEAKAVAFARYFILDRAVDAVPKKFDVGGSSAAKLSDQVKNLERQRDQARETAEGYGLWVATGAGGYVGVFTAVGPR